MYRHDRRREFARQAYLEEQSAKVSQRGGKCVFVRACVRGDEKGDKPGMVVVVVVVVVMVVMVVVAACGV